MPRPAASLSEATGGDLDRSVRHRELKRPNGFGDELRAALVGESATWGALTLLRASDRVPFAATDADVVGALSRYVAEGLRRAMLLTALSADRPDDEEPAGLVLLARRQLDHAREPRRARCGSPSCARATAPGERSRRW